MVVMVVVKHVVVRSSTGPLLLFMAIISCDRWRTPACYLVDRIPSQCVRASGQGFAMSKIFWVPYTRLFGTAADELTGQRGCLVCTHTK